MIDVEALSDDNAIGGLDAKSAQGRKDQMAFLLGASSASAWFGRTVHLSASFIGLAAGYSILPFLEKSFRWSAAGRWTRWNLVRVGGIFPKLLQIASTRGDLWEEGFRAELAVARRKCGNGAIEQSEFSRLVAELPLFIDARTASVIGVGAAAVVFKCWSPSLSRFVVVKVVKRAARRQFELDRRSVFFATRLIEPFALRFGFSASQGVRDLDETLQYHFDMPREARLGNAVGGAIDDPTVRVPRAYVSTDRLIVLQHIEGLTELDAWMGDDDCRFLLAEALTRLIFRMIFRIGIVHCDLHPGNIQVDGQGNLVILDFGGARVLPEIVRLDFREFFFCMATNNFGRGSRLLLQMARPLSPTRLPSAEGFKEGVRQMFHRVAGQLAIDFRVAGFAVELFKLHRQHGLVASPDFTSILLALTLVEGTLLKLNPNVDFQTIGLEVLMDPRELPAWA